MEIVTQTKIEKITIPCRYLEDWNGKEYLFHKLEGKYTSASFCFSISFNEMSSDGLSVPRELRDRIERVGRRLVAGLWHDYLYAAELFPRSLSDWIFLEILEYKDSNDRKINPDVAPSRLWGWIVRNGAWVAVKAGGGKVWKKHVFEEVFNFRKMIKLTITAIPDDLREDILKQENAMLKKGYPRVIVMNC